MTEWKEKIEAQIEYLTTMLGVQLQQRSRPSMMLVESIESLKLLLDVAVAAEAYEDERYHDTWRALKDALDKLREVGDD